MATASQATAARMPTVLLRACSVADSIALTDVAERPYRLAAAAAAGSRPPVSTSRSSKPEAWLPKDLTACPESTSSDSLPSPPGKECSTMPTMVKLVVPLPVATGSTVPTRQSSASARLSGASRLELSASAAKAWLRLPATSSRPPSRA